MKFLKEAERKNMDVNKEYIDSVSKIINDIRAGGDKALREYSLKFDSNDAESFLLTRKDIEDAYKQLDDSEIEDMKLAHKNIQSFASEQRKCIKPLTDFSPMEGIFLGHSIIPIQSCLCYVPGGNYPLYSTALMLITPAKIAGVKRVVASSPIDKRTKKINPRTVVAMDIAGADEIYSIGGVQAIAAFAYGTESIDPVNLIVGPGNKYVAEAKRQCYGQVGIDFVAGPSEVLVIADKDEDPEIIAADLLAQAEHDVNSSPVLVTDSEDLGKAVIKSVENQLKDLATAEIAEKSWQSNGAVVLVENLDEAAKYANKYAPEHLEVNVKNPDELVGKLTNYGSLFIGQNTAEVFGDYASGTNHTLPTLKAAKYTGGLWVGKFLKVCTYQKMTEEASRNIAPLASRMAEGEGLIAHSLAAKKRIK